MELVRKLHSLESEVDIEEITSRGKWVYPVLKQHIIVPLISKASNQVKGSNSGAVSTSVLNNISEYAKWWIKYQSPSSCDMLILDSSFSRRKAEGFYYSIYTDFLPEIFEDRKSLTLEMPSPHKPFHRLPVFTRRIVFPDRQISKALARSKLRKIRMDSGYDVFREIMQQLDLTYVESLVDDYVTRFFQMRKYFLEVLRRTNPSLTFLVSSYSYSKMAFADACKEFNIPSIELQHGHIYSDHTGYVYKMVPSLDLFPDYFFSFGSHFSELLQSESRMFHPDRIISAGFNYLEKSADTESRLSPEIVVLSNKKKLILLTSQWNISDMLRNFIDELVEILPEEFMLVYKAHPAEKDTSLIRRVYEKSDKVFIVDDPMVNVLDLLKIAHIHTTVFSTSHFEAAFLGIPNIFIQHEKLSSRIDGFLDEQSNRLAVSAEEFVRLLGEIGSDYENACKHARDKSQEYFLPGSEKNIVDAVEGILST